MSASTPNLTVTQPTKKELISMYLHQLTCKEKIAYQIAKEHLGSSFNIIKSSK